MQKYPKMVIKYAPWPAAQFHFLKKTEMLFPLLPTESLIVASRLKITSKNPLVQDILFSLYSFIKNVTSQ